MICVPKFAEKNWNEDLTSNWPICLFPWPNSKWNSKKRGSSWPQVPQHFFPLQFLKQFTVSLSLLGHFPHQINESLNKRLTKMFTFGNKLSVKALLEKTSHNLPLLFNEIISERQNRSAGAGTEIGKDKFKVNPEASPQGMSAVLSAPRSLTSPPLPSCFYTFWQLLNKTSLGDNSFVKIKC